MPAPAMLVRLKLFLLLLLPLLSLGVARPVSAEEEPPERAAADMLPASTVLYAELPRVPELLDLVLDHPLREKLQSLEPYRQAVERPDFLRLKAAVSIFEAEMELPWRKIAKALGDGGVYFGFDGSTRGAALLVQSRDEAALDKAREVLFRLVRAEAQRQGRDDPLKTARYRDTTVHRIGPVRFATLGRWLIVTNQDELGKQLIDGYLSDERRGLSGDSKFQAARATRDAQAAAWFYADVQTLREADGEENRFARALRGPRDNPAAELLLGGVFTALRQAPYATLSLLAGPREVQVVAQMPFDTSELETPREYFFGAKGQGTAPPLLEVKRPLLTVAAHRDVSRMWLHAGDLFDEQVNDGLAQANSNLSTLFSGKDFGEEILGAMEPGLQIVVVRQDFADKLPQPAIKLPAFALVGRLKDAETMRDELRRIFMSLVGFLNVVGAMNGQPQLDFEMSGEGAEQTIATRYVVAEKDRDNRQAAINYNFSPTVAFRGATFILASTSELARELASAPAAPATAPSDETLRPNTLARLHLPALRDILNDNANQLVAQNMLEEGNSREEAEGEIDLLLDLIGMLRTGEIRLASGDGRLVLRTSVSLADSP